MDRGIRHTVRASNRTSRPIPSCTSASKIHRKVDGGQHGSGRRIIRIARYPLRNIHPGSRCATVELQSGVALITIPPPRIGIVEHRKIVNEGRGGAVRYAVRTRSLSLPLGPNCTRVPLGLATRGSTRTEGVNRIPSGSSRAGLRAGEPFGRRRVGGAIHTLLRVSDGGGGCCERRLRPECRRCQ